MKSMIFSIVDLPGFLLASCISAESDGGLASGLHCVSNSANLLFFFSITFVNFQLRNHPTSKKDNQHLREEPIAGRSFLQF